MDHLPHARNGPPIDISVPVLGASSVGGYDGAGFDTFPQRRGHELEDGWLRFSSLKSDSASGEFVQEWLYFGLLEEIFGSAYRRRDFVLESESGLCIVSTKELPRLIATKRDSASTLQERERIHILLSRALRQCCHLDQDLGSAQPSWPRILLSIRILIQTLEVLGVKKHGAFSKVTNAEISPWPFLGSATYWPWLHLDPPSLWPISDILQRQGWCVHQIRRFSSRCTYATLVYLTTLPRLPRAWTDHSKCAFQDECTVYNIDNATFEGRHVDPTCTCSHVLAPLGQMRSILRDGGIPILRCERSSSGFGTPSLSYVAAHPNIKYTAISHLWSDGLGQPSRNSLPQCQLIRLMNAVNEADAKFKTETNPLYARLFDVYHEFGSFSRNTSYPKWPARVILEDSWYDRAARRTRTSMTETRDSIHLWLDVYCVPVDNEDLRRKAIARMTPTYSRATHVHVLDHDLQQMEENNNVLDMMAQIAVCGWGTRAWTTQERSLAMGITYGIGCGSNPMVWSSGWHGLWDRIYISNYAQFSEQGFCHYAVSAQIYTDLIDEIQGGQLNPLGITGESTNFFESSPLRFNRGWRFARVWNALRVKNTTKAEDSLGIFANLLGLSAGEILHLSTKDQMKAILASHQFLPIDLLLTITPRYLIDNQTGRQECSLEEQWIPKGPRSDIDLAWSQELEGLETMRVLPEGLLIDSHDLTPDDGTTHAMVGVHVFQPRGDHVALDLDGEGLDGTPTRRRYWVSLQRDGHDCGLSSNVDSLYFVLRVRTGWSQADNPALFRARGACLIPKGMSNGRLCMIYACPVFWGFSIDEVVTENFRFQPSNSVVCSARLHTDGDPDILVGCDIGNWPKLSTRRDLMVLETAKHQRILIYCFAVLIVTISISYTISWLLFVFNVFDYNYLTVTFIELAVVLSLAALCTLVYFLFSRAQYYHFLSTYDPDIDPTESFFFRLRRVLPNASGGNVPKTERALLYLLRSAVSIGIAVQQRPQQDGQIRLE